MNVKILYTIGQILFWIVTVVLFFIGLRLPIKYIKIEKYSKDIVKKSCILLCCAVASYMMTRLFSNLYEFAQQTENYPFLSILGQSIWEAIRNTGFLVLIPFILRRKKEF